MYSNLGSLGDVSAVNGSSDRCSSSTTVENLAFGVSFDGRGQFPAGN